MIGSRSSGRCRKTISWRRRSRPTAPARERVADVRRSSVVLPVVAGLLFAGGLLAGLLDAAEPIRYRFSFPFPEHHWMQVEVAFTGLDRSPLELRMSRTSPGRYSLHEFVKNVYDVRASDPSGRDLAITRSDPY